jgi:predicted O-methyltransferase YrrM
MYRKYKGMFLNREGKEKMLPWLFNCHFSVLCIFQFLSPCSVTKTKRYISEFKITFAEYSIYFYCLIVMRISLAFRYLLYRLTAPHRRGFGVHSPFVFNLVTRVFTKKDDVNLSEIRKWRRQLGKNRTVIETADLGAGSKAHPSKKRNIGSIAKRSSLLHKYGRILYSLVKEFKPATVIELGTGIGISTAYMAMGRGETRIISVDSDPEKIRYAAEALKAFPAGEIDFVKGDFRAVIPGILATAGHPLMVFVDGDHDMQRTMEYYKEIKKSAKEDTVIVFDDIRWSAEMEKAWDAIRNDNDTVICIDLFLMGIVFFRKGITKQDFVINF